MSRHHRRARAASHIQHRRMVGILIAVAAGLLTSPPAHAAASSPLAGSAGFGSALAGFAPVGTGPTAVAINPATHTIYVADGYNYSGPNGLGDTVAVIDARHCNARISRAARARGRRSRSGVATPTTSRAESRSTRRPTPCT